VGVADARVVAVRDAVAVEVAGSVGAGVGVCVVVAIATAVAVRVGVGVAVPIAVGVPLGRLGSPALTCLVSPARASMNASTAQPAASACLILDLISQAILGCVRAPAS
jgi:hypothetical protein